MKNRIFFRSKDDCVFQAHALQNHGQSTTLFHNYDTKCEEPVQDENLQEVPCIKEEQLEVDIKVEHVEVEPNLEDDVNNSDSDFDKAEFSDDTYQEPLEISHKKKIVQEFCRRCNKNIPQNTFTAHLESCHPNNEDFQVCTFLKKVFCF